MHEMERSRRSRTCGGVACSNLLAGLVGHDPNFAFFCESPALALVPISGPLLFKRGEYTPTCSNLIQIGLYPPIATVVEAANQAHVHEDTQMSIRAAAVS